MRTIYIVAGAVLLLAGIFLMNVIDVAAGALTLTAATRGIGSMRTFGRVCAAFFAVLAALGVVRSDLWGLVDLSTRDTLLHAGAALVFLYVGLLAPPRL